MAAREAFSLAVSAGKLDGEALTHKVGPIFAPVSTEIDDKAQPEEYRLLRRWVHHAGGERRANVR